MVLLSCRNYGQSHAGFFAPPASHNSRGWLSAAPEEARDALPAHSRYFLSCREYDLEAEFRHPPHTSDFSFADCARRGSSMLPRRPQPRVALRPRSVRGISLRVIAARLSLLSLLFERSLWRPAANLPLSSGYELGLGAGLDRRPRLSVAQPHRRLLDRLLRTSGSRLLRRPVQSVGPVSK